jgi:hypothetical protein
MQASLSRLESQITHRMLPQAVMVGIDANVSVGVPV